MNSDTKRKPPQKKQEQLTYEDFNDDTWFSLVDVLVRPEVSVAALATYIKKEGVKTFDTHGKLIVATDGDDKQFTSKARALDLLACYYKELREAKELPQGWHPPQDPNRWLEHESPLLEFGWPKNEIPDDIVTFVKGITDSLFDTKKVSSSTGKENLHEWKEQAADTSSLEQTVNSQDTETPQPIANWKMRIQAQAAIIWCKYKKMGCSPTKLNINTELAKWCKDNDVTTDYGIWPTESYIYRHVTRKWDPPKC